MDEFRQRVLDILNGGLWHTTSINRFEKILEGGAILAEPNLQDSERWNTGCGPQNYPFVRTLKGISLFDFNDFDPISYDQKYPVSSWEYFVPFHLQWGKAVWVEISRDANSEKFISGKKLLEIWKSQEAYRHNLMPLIEAAYLGDLPKSTFLRAILVQQGTVTSLEIT